MLHKFIFVALCTISFISCNSKEEKKNEPSVQQTNNSSMVTPSNPSIDLSGMESKFARDSNNYELRAMLASNYYAAGVLDKAAYHFLKVYEHDNKNLIALSSLGNIYYDSRQDDKAIMYYEKALELDPKNINMRCDMATCYSNINKLKKAIEILKENIEMDKTHAQSHYNLSVILKKNGDIKEADEQMKIYTDLKSGTK